LKSLKHAAYEELNIYRLKKLYRIKPEQKSCSNTAIQHRINEVICKLWAKFQKQTSPQSVGVHYTLMSADRWQIMILQRTGACTLTVVSITIITNSNSSSSSSSSHQFQVFRVSPFDM